MSRCTQIGPHIFGDVTRINKVYPDAITTVDNYIDLTAVALTKIPRLKTKPHRFGDISLVTHDWQES